MFHVCKGNANEEEKQIKRIKIILSGWKFGNVGKKT
jgi:hypothetical protein